jgi:transcriptional regulator
VLELLARLQGARDADGGVDVPDDHDAPPRRFVDDRIVHGARDEERDLHLIVASVRDRAHGGASRIRVGDDDAVRHGAADEVRARHEKLRTEHAAARYIPAEREVLWSADHQTRGRDAIRDHHAELGGRRRIRDRIIVRVQVGMHVRETGDEIPPRSIDPARVRGDHDSLSDSGNAAVSNQNSRIADDRIGRHWDDVHVRDRERPGYESAPRIERLLGDRNRGNQREQEWTHGTGRMVRHGKGYGFDIGNRQHGCRDTCGIPVTALPFPHMVSTHPVREGRMAREALGLVQGTVDVLILKTLTWAPMHGYGISHWIRQRTDGELAVEDAALYQALHRLERKGWVGSEWGVSDTNRKAKFYSITPDGRKHLREDVAELRRYVDALFKILQPT